VRLVDCVLVAIVSAVACAPPKSEPFTPESIARGRDAAARIDGAAMKIHVEKIIEGRKAETPMLRPFIGDAAELVPHTRVNSAKYVEEAFRAIGFEPRVEASSDNGIDGVNIWVEVPGNEPSQVLVTAHHDAWYQSGADDNASAIAILIEAARVLREHRFRRTIRFVAFDTEELGLVGVQRYRAVHAGDPVHMLLNMDCVGFFSSAPESQDAPTGLGLRDKGDFIAVLANEPAQHDAARVVRMAPQIPDAVDVLGLIAPGDSHYPASAPFLGSDHVVYWTAEVPALFFTDTAFLRNKNYHTEGDLPETLEYTFLARAARAITASVVAFAEQ
jgi:hypothetical protein